MDGEYRSLDELRTQVVRFFRNGGTMAARPADPNYPKRRWLGSEGSALDGTQELTVQVLGN